MSCSYLLNPADAKIKGQSSIAHFYKAQKVYLKQE